MMTPPTLPAAVCRTLGLASAVFSSALSAMGCGGGDSGPPADVHGSYSLSITNGPSTCNLAGWTEGSQSTNIPATVTQNGTAVTWQVGGLPGAFLRSVLGSDTFTGQVSGNDLDLLLTGTASLTAGACKYTIDAHASATVSGDVVQGSVRYTPKAPASADCAGVRTCSASQQFNGTRPPTQ